MEKTFANEVKVAMSSMQSSTQDKKLISVIKFSPMRAGGEIGVNSKYTIFHIQLLNNTTDKPAPLNRRKMSDAARKTLI